MTDEREIARESAVDRLLAGCSAWYDVTRYPAERRPLAALCEFYQTLERYAFTRRANLWTAQNEEFLYVFSVSSLTADAWEGIRAHVIDDGLKRAHIGPQHMCTCATALVVCDEITREGSDALRRSKFIKNFKFSLYGWLELRAAAIEAGGDHRAISNRRGADAAKLAVSVLSGGAEGGAKSA